MKANTEMIAICKQKGFVEKTVTTVNLGINLARQGKRVLLLDVDPQGSLTASLLMKRLPPSIMDEPMSPVRASFARRKV